MSDQIPVQESTKKLVDILRAGQKKGTSYDTLILALVKEKLEFAKDWDIRNAIALSISQDFVMNAMKIGILREYDEQIANILRFILVGSYDPAMDMLRLMKIPDGVEE